MKRIPRQVIYGRPLSFRVQQSGAVVHDTRNRKIKIYGGATSLSSHQSELRWRDDGGEEWYCWRETKRSSSITGWESLAVSHQERWLACRPGKAGVEEPLQSVHCPVQKSAATTSLAASCLRCSWGKKADSLMYTMP